jgi:hypothetical protein
MERALVPLIAVAVAVFAAQASAHHSISRMYHENEIVMIEGELAQLHLRNPHSIMHVVVRDRSRGEMRYAIEWAAAGELADHGVTPRTLKVGDYLVITGNPARNADDRRIHMTALFRPKDNYSYSRP